MKTSKYFSYPQLLSELGNKLYIEQIPDTPTEFHRIEWKFPDEYETDEIANPSNDYVIEVYEEGWALVRVKDNTLLGARMNGNLYVNPMFDEMSDMDKEYLKAWECDSTLDNAILLY